MLRRTFLAIAGLASAIVFPGQRPASAAEDPAAVAAIVNDEKITVADVQQALDQATAGRQLTAAERSQLEREALERLIDRRLVEAFLKKSGDWPTAPQIEQALKQVRLQLEQQKLTWQDFFAVNHSNAEAYKQRIAWQLAWEKYLQNRLTDDRLEAWFQAHRADFDGTQVRVSHLLLKADSDSPAAVAAALESAGRIRDDIVQGKLSFAAAVKKFSAGPSREQAGDLGFIPRHGVMVEAFSRAAFQLKPGEISPPVKTPFGVHLIQVVEVRPGNRHWTDVRDEIRRAAAQAAYDEFAREQRATANISRTK